MLMAEHGKGRPTQKATQNPDGCRAESSSASYRRHLDERADRALRIAWLTAHGHYMFDVDPTGQTSAQLWDLRDLLEAQDAEGGWAS